MGKVSFAGHQDNPIGETYSTARGPVLRSGQSEVARVFFSAGQGAQRHAHPEEQTLYVLSGRLQVTLGHSEGAETYEVGPGQGSFHPSNVPHQATALEDTNCVSFKNLVDPSTYQPTGQLA
jgi:quercetin dioxygenase-like cupin family protein